MRAQLDLDYLWVQKVSIDGVTAVSEVRSHIVTILEFPQECSVFHLGPSSLHSTVWRCECSPAVRKLPVQLEIDCSYLLHQNMQSLQQYGPTMYL